MQRVTFLFLAALVALTVPLWAAGNPVGTCVGMTEFGFALTDGTAMNLTLKVGGDKMAGEWRHPEGGAGAITLERTPAK
jgi:hypothetical protein